MTNLFVMTKRADLAHWDVKEIFETLAEIDGSAGVVLWLEEPPDALSISVALVAIAKGKRAVACVKAGVDPYPPALYLSMDHLPVYGGLANQDDAERLAGFVIAHDERGTCTGGPYAAPLLEMLERCESPIEQRLLLHVWNMTLGDGVIAAQVPVTAGGNNYRLDIALTDRIGDRSVLIAVEADGHTFHERTKEQAQRDKARDRALVLDGWSMLRFTGSEIWRDPRAGAVQVRDLSRRLSGLED